MLSRIFDMEPYMNMTFKEISAWISATVTIAVYGYFLVRAPHTDTIAAALGLYVAIVILYVVAQTALHIAAAIIHKPEKNDECDELIAAKSSRYASFILMSGMVAATILLLGADERLRPFTGLPPVVLTVHFMILISAFSELLRFVAQIVYYRRGA
jgi:uncharacterized membrane protein YfcA